MEERQFTESKIHRPGILPHWLELRRAKQRKPAPENLAPETSEART
jgi:hypothetical protein